MLNILKWYSCKPVNRFHSAQFLIPMIKSLKQLYTQLIRSVNRC